MAQAKNVVEIHLTELSDFIDKHRANSNVRAQLIEELDRKLIGNCLKRYRGNQTRVAEVLGINRGMLRTRMKELGFMDSAA